MGISSKITHYKRLAHNYVRDSHNYKHERSSKWPKVEKEFLRKNPFCAACATIHNLNVHHKVPFHIAPELELEESNLITLCMSEDRHCHLLIGHGNSFKAYVPDVDIFSKEALDAHWKNDIEKVAAVVQKAKDARKV